MAGNSTPNPAGRGLFSSLKTVFSVLLQSAGTRLELLVNEVQEEKLRCVDLALLLLGMMFCFVTAVLTGILFLTALFWDNRVPLLCGFAITFTSVGIFLSVRFRHVLAQPSKIFEASLSELREDIRQLKEATTTDGDLE
jgi:uncharacterized membrane protein YqjE